MFLSNDKITKKKEKYFCLKIKKEGDIIILSIDGVHI